MSTPPDSKYVASPQSKYAPSTKISKTQPISLDTICRVFYPFLFPQNGNPKGLLAIFGETGSAKSEIARGLIYRYLEQRKEEYRKGKKDNLENPKAPHLVTFEDPIEKYYFEAPQSPASEDVKWTAREKGTHVEDLETAIEDALRQTPTVFYVGEVRKKEDWKEVMNFASTGHLVVTTSHAGSLVESMERALEAVGASSSAERGSYAHRILGVIHLVRVTIDGVSILMPALWHQKPRGLASLVADGLSSILPHNIKELNSSSIEVSSVGRRWFVNKLFVEGNAAADKIRQSAQDDEKKKQCAEIAEMLQGSLKAKFEKRALELDLKGE